MAIIYFPNLVSGTMGAGAYLVHDDVLLSLHEGLPYGHDVDRPQFQVECILSERAGNLLMVKAG